MEGKETQHLTTNDHKKVNKEKKKMTNIRKSFSNIKVIKLKNRTFSIL